MFKDELSKHGIRAGLLCKQISSEEYRDKSASLVSFAFL